MSKYQTNNVNTFNQSSVNWLILFTSTKRFIHAIRILILLFLVLIKYLNNSSNANYDYQWPMGTVCNLVYGGVSVMLQTEKEVDMVRLHYSRYEYIHNKLLPILNLLVL